MDELGQEQSECVGEILNAGNHRLDLINEVLDLSKIETGGMQLNIDSLNNKHGYVQLRITDTGPGVAADAQAVIFEPFNRLGAEYSDIEGTGIGLIIAHQLVNMMNCRN